MSLARIGSDGSLLLSNYLASGMVFAADNVAQRIGSQLLVQRAILEVSGTGTVTVLADDGVTQFKSLVTGSEWILEGAPGTVFDLNKLQFKSTAHTTQVFTIFYQK